MTFGIRIYYASFLSDKCKCYQGLFNEASLIKGDLMDRNLNKDLGEFRINGGINTSPFSPFLFPCLPLEA